MVNYCCVYGCGRNSKTSKHLYYYGLPKERNRLLQWLEAIGRTDLLERDHKKLTHRVCSRHFSPSNIKNKHLCADAVPTLCLSNYTNDGSNESETQTAHDNIVCNSCNKSILGFRYKCITCPDYDLCSKCEMLEAHDQHYLLRIPKPVNFAVADNLIKKWRKLIKKENNKSGIKTDIDCTSSDDDVPITKYVKNYDSGIELTEEEKSKIRDEVTRVLNIKNIHTEDLAKGKQKALKRKLPQKKRRDKEFKELVEICVGAEEMATVSTVPEVFFADVNDIATNQNLDVKEEIANTLTPLVAETDSQIEHSIKLNDELSEFLIGVKYPGT
ncbi:unnamed protein product [Spodoptera littoralis]|uniref:Uncharacterized protein n=1 Tax=Spodoptera littoralis TaxID=7109 RepID=A0A9P0N8S0_SPOLI|nr:unnamed protein product [Spodoptera littoralis]CAH1643941.1 unnamed protein product [Spodoptera littoralis]